MKISIRLAYLDGLVGINSHIVPQNWGILIAQKGGQIKFLQIGSAEANHQ